MNYELLLREHQLKVTPQRLGILKRIGYAGHLDVEKLFTQIKKEFSTISLATLYKNINSMVEKTLLTEVKIPHRKSKYEITKDPHIHLLCSECDEFIDMSVDIERLVDEAKQKSHYQLTNSSIVLCGICESCQLKKSA
jgi:Fur family peroxide stress response transcriptional regulator